MSGYVKNTWVNQDVERPKTYEVTTNADGSITLTDSFGLVTELGTPVNADNMNHIEDGLTRVSITEYDNTFTYSEDDWVTGIVDGEKTICRSKTDNNTGNALSNGTYWEVLKLGGGGSGYQLGDIVLKDHILSYAESLGLAQLGTYFYKEAIAGTRYGYPDYYQKLINEYQGLNNTTDTVDSVTVTINANGHKFYDIADKATFDNMYAITGEAWYYGIDITNERIFLPRSTRFKNGTNVDVGEYQAAGLPNITGNTGFIKWGTNQGTDGAITTSLASHNKATTSDGNQWAESHFAFSASDSNPIYGASNTVEYSSTKLIPYMVVGNTANESSVIDVVDVTTSENDTLPLFTGIYFDYAPNNVSWVMAGGQVVSGTIYVFAYNELVNELTTPKYNLNVIDVDDMVVGTDYSTYWKVDQTNQTFTCPIRTSERVLVAKKEATNADPTWYNLYNDGWCEQGGYIGDTTNAYYTLTFSIDFIDRNYYFNRCNVSNNTQTPTGFANEGVYGDITTHGLTIYNNLSYTNDTYWIACGYSAVPDITDYTEPLRMYFKVANAVQNLELLDAGEVLEAVNTVIPNNKNLITSYCTLDTSRMYQTTSRNITITTPSYVSVFGQITGYQKGEIYVNNVFTNCLTNPTNVNVYIGGACFIADKDDVITFGTGFSSADITTTIIPLKGAQ